MSSPAPSATAGVFETLLVLDGRPLELEPHLARLAASLSTLFGAGCPPVARRLVIERAHGAELARLRLTVAPDERGTLAAQVAVAPVDASLVLPSPEGGVQLAPLTVRGGLGAHKWADRRLLERAEAQFAPSVPLLVDRDGSVLEASRGNVFAILDGVLLTPPTDGRILPGVTRRRVLRLAALLGVPVREERFSVERLADGAEVFLTGAVRGIEPVTACAGTAMASEHGTTGRLADALRHHWALEAPAAADHVARRGGAVHAQVD